MIRRTAILFFLILLTTLLFLPVVESYAYTLTFDDAPMGYYKDHYGAGFAAGFQITDHSASIWGVPRSGNNVMTYSWDSLSSGGGLKFRYPTNEVYTITSLGAYFSTELGAVVRIDAYHGDDPQPVSSVVIGAVGQSWNNVYAEVTSPTGEIDHVVFRGVSSDEALLHFCADDMTIDPVPEPSALLALTCGLGALGLPMLRRKVK